MATMLQGLDVSSNQGDVKFDAVREAGFRFCICKATEGADYKDSRFATNLQRIRDLNAGSSFHPGAYHFARPDNRTGRSGGETEGKWFCKVLEQTVADLGMSLAHDFIEPVLDMETYNESSASENIAWIEGFLAVVKGETGRNGMIYTGPNYWRYQVGDTDQFASAGIPLWEVKYSKRGSDPTQSPPRMPTDTRKRQWSPVLWQWSGGGEYAYYGRVPGIPSGIADVNRVMGDESIITRLAAATTQPTPDAGAPIPQGWSLPTLDISDRRGRTSTTIARVQGLLLSHGYGPDGLIASSTGRPDGLVGSATTNAFIAFKRAAGLPGDTILDEATWQQLVQRGLD